MGVLDGKLALVTGASRGIGVAIARRFAAEGARVVLTARSLDANDRLPGSLRETLALIEAAGGSGLAIAADLADPGSRAALIERCLREAGSPDILVNNAAAAFYLPLQKISARRFHVAMEINVRAPLELAQACVPGMIERGAGWILNISSATAKHPAPPWRHWDVHGGALLYGASKAALDRMSAGMAAELQQHGVVVNSLAPVAAVITPGVEALGLDQSDPNFTVEPVEAMAEAALALCSGTADGVTGAVLYSLDFLRRTGRTVRGLDGRGEIAID